MLFTWSTEDKELIFFIKYFYEAIGILNKYVYV